MVPSLRLPGSPIGICQSLHINLWFVSHLLVLGPPFSFCLALTVSLFLVRILLSRHSVGRFPLPVYLVPRPIETILSVEMRPPEHLIAVYQVNSYRYMETAQMIQNLVSRQSSPSLTSIVLLFSLVLRSGSCTVRFLGVPFGGREVIRHIVSCCLLSVRILNSLRAKKRIVFYLECGRSLRSGTQIRRQFPVDVLL